MQNLVTVLGIIIRTEPIGEFDRRLVILTREKGKITVFARGARRQNNRFLATTTPFCFGEFVLFTGHNSYSLSEANISHFFEEIRSDYENSLYGMYFMELADYYTRESKDEADQLKLLFQSLRALASGRYGRKFLKAVYEIKTIMINGEFPGIPDRRDDLAGMDKVIRFLWECRPEKVYTFAVSERLEQEMIQTGETAVKNMIDKKLNTLELLETLTE
ncbi:MAG: DNA repair protein RecO [Lachnospiraceae bacterium]|nr:DNA repair protein RecO [Lachnospiraceae bacterium]